MQTLARGQVLILSGCKQRVQRVFLAGWERGTAARAARSIVPFTSLKSSNVSSGRISARQLRFARATRSYAGPMRPMAAADGDNVAKFADG